LKKNFKIQLKKDLKSIRNKNKLIAENVFCLINHFAILKIKLEKIQKMKKLANILLKILIRILYKTIFFEKIFYFFLSHNSCEKFFYLKIKIDRIKLEIKKSFLLIKLYNHLFINRNLILHKRDVKKFSNINLKILNTRKNTTLPFLNINHFALKIFPQNISFFIDDYFNFKIYILNKLYSEFFAKSSIIIKKILRNYTLICAKLFIVQVHFLRISEFLNFLFDVDIFSKLIYRLISKGGIVEIDSINMSDPYVEGITSIC
jgi:hypothetical protein